MMKLEKNIHLYGILDLGYVPLENTVTITSQLLTSGVQILQLRAKKATVEEIVSIGRAILPLCKAACVPLVINDYPEIAVRIGADGVHIGQNDASVAEVRKIVGTKMLIGKSSHSLAQAQTAAAECPDYLGFGPLFATPTKPDYVPIGLADIAEVYRRVSLPVFCIGGIKLENLPTVIAAGAQRVVIVSGLLQAKNIQEYGKACRLALIS